LMILDRFIMWMINSSGLDDDNEQITINN